MEKLKNNREKLNKRKLAAVFGLIGGLILAGCSEHEGSEKENKEVEIIVPTVNKEYYDNGISITTYENTDLMSTILSFCDGNDLVDQTEFIRNRSGAAGNSLSRSVGHPACADGSLTESDFNFAK